MLNFDSTDPIIAISTAQNEKAGIGIIRISGFDNLSFLSKISGLNHKEIKPRYAHFIKVVIDSNFLDEGLCLFFPSPNSFTGENLFELQLHGNPLHLNRIVDKLTEILGFRRAEAGEFSYRSLKNNKMNLTQVEGLDLLLNSNSAFGLSAGTESLNNELYNKYQKLRNEFLELKACFELSIDFSEDVGEEEIKAKFTKHLKTLEKLLDELRARCVSNLSDLLSPKIVLFGPTNAGKSTLFNSLVGFDRAIVSNVHGTTRDFVSETLFINSLPFNLVDTAGIRNTTDLIEKLGIEKSVSLKDNAFFRIRVINPLLGIGSYSSNLLDKEFDLTIFTHMDEPGYKDSLMQFQGLIGSSSFGCGPIGPGNAENFGPIGPVFGLAPIGPGLEIGPIGPINMILDRVFIKFQLLMDLNPIPFQRHVEAIGIIHDRFGVLVDDVECGDAAIVGSHINNIGLSIDELVGVISPQDVLDHIFANFCIGK